MNATTAKRLANYKRKYEQLAAQIPKIGFISAGSVVKRYTRCTNSNCRCRGNPQRPHGPYFQWTTKVKGRTVTKGLTEREARLYKNWIANDRKLSAVVTKMREVALKAEILILEDEAKSSV